MIDETTPEAAEASSPPVDWPALSPRQRQVADLLARGHTNSEIAGLLEISIKTVEAHRYHVLVNLRLRNNVALARYAIRNGFVSSAAEDDR